jgi:hypothetical protein
MEREGRRRLIGPPAAQEFRAAVAAAKYKWR